MQSLRSNPYTNYTTVCAIVCFICTYIFKQKMQIQTMSTNGGKKTNSLE